MKKNKNEYWLYPTDFIELKDPPREACIIDVDNNGNEISREYFGPNPRIIKNLNYEKL